MTQLEYASPSVRGKGKAAFWIGWVLSVLPVPLLLMSAYMKLSRNPMAVEGFAKAGYAENALIYIGVVEVACTVLYLIPRTSALGAILLAAYLGGATNHHVRGQESFVAPVVMGVVLWVGLVLREPRLRAVLPFAIRE